MKQHDRTINVTANTDLTSLVEEITTAQEEILRIVVPSGAKVLRSEIGLKLLNEKASQHNKKIVFLTDDEIGRSLLERVGFIVKPPSKPKDHFFEALAAKSKVKISDITPPHAKPSLLPETSEKEKSPAITPSPPEEKKVFIRKKISSLKEPAQKEYPSYIPTEAARETEIPRFALEAETVSSTVKKRRVFSYLIAFVGVSAGIFIFVSLFLLPSAKIVITPKRTVEPVNFNIVIAPSIQQLSSPRLEIPGQFLKLERELSATFPATGKKFVEEKATGKVRLYNAFSSAPQTLVASTRLLSTDGKIFRISKQVQVPGAGVEEGKIIPNSIVIDVLADEPGEQFNIGPTTFSIPGFAGSPKFNGFYGKSEEPMRGGFRGEVTELTEDDLSGARASLEGRVFNLLEQELPSRIPSSLTIIEQGRLKQIESFRTSAQAQDRAKTFEATLKGSLSVMAFKEDDLEELAKAQLASKLTADTFVESIEPFSYSDVQFDVKSQTLRMLIKADSIIAWKIDQGELARKVLGQNEVELRRLLAEVPAVERAKITLWPFWSSKVPQDLEKIKIEVD